MPIRDQVDLREHLQTAIELEHSTLPPYLCALYSLKSDSNGEARAVLQSVAIEEMLHLTLAANLLNAVGGAPVLDHPRLLPMHPTPLPHGDGSVMLSLRAFSKAAIEGFMAVERPGTAECAPQADGYASIGQFYAAIDEALVRLSATLGEKQLFSGDPARQVTDDIYYGGSGRIIAVTDLSSAQAAIREIVEQGEGLDHQSIFDGFKDMFHPERDDLGHYFRFVQLLRGQSFQRGDTPASGPTGAPLAVDWDAVWPMAENAKSSDHVAGSSAHQAMKSFDTSYCTLLQLLERTFNGLPQLLRFATGAMYGLKQQMIELMAMNGGNQANTVGPSFEWIPREQRVFDCTSISVLPAGPYLVRGDVDVFDVQEQLRKHGGVCVLCRCGGSRTKPFCDGTHARIGFIGEEKATHDTAAERRKAYPAPDGAIVYDDRSRCAHFGQCTDRCPAAFGVAEDHFVNATAAPTKMLESVCHGCPSGALSFAPAGSKDPVEEPMEPAIRPIVDGPYRVRGGVPVFGGDGRSYDVRQRQTLCRCGNSNNKPFCDGSHWYAGFRDPAPPEVEAADRYPWTIPGAAEDGRARYAREQAARKATNSSLGPN